MSYILADQCANSDMIDRLSHLSMAGAITISIFLICLAAVVIVVIREIF